MNLLDDNDLTPKQAEALDKAAQRPPVKIEVRDLPSRFVQTQIPESPQRPPDEPTERPT